MGWLSRITGSDTAAADPRAFAWWTDPPLPQSDNPHTRRLREYARKCARELSGQGVPLFSSAYPRDGRSTYRDAFWVIRVDVEGAQRSYVNGPVPRHKTPAGHPPPLKQGEYMGNLNGRALLLSKTGVLASSRIEGWLTRDGQVNDRTMDMIFPETTHNERLMLTEDWGWFDRGRWRRDGGGIRWASNWRNNGERDDTGKGTSAALSRFVKSGGEIQWPRNFCSMST